MFEKEHSVGVVLQKLSLLRRVCHVFGYLGVKSFNKSLIQSEYKCLCTQIYVGEV